MNCLRNSRSVFSRLLTLRRYCNPTQPSPAPRSRSDVLDSTRGLFFRPAKPAASCRTPALSLPAAISRSQPSIHRARGWYRDPWKVAGASAAAVLLPYATVFTACAAVSHTETVPYTNRTHRVMFSPKLERKLGNEDFEELKKERSKDILGPSDPKTVRVRHIASDIIRGIQELFPADGLADDDAKQGKAAVQSQTGHLDDLQWEVIVIRDNRVNACTLGGGKIVVFTGLLNFLETDAEIAAVIAHDVAGASAVAVLLPYATVFTAGAALSHKETVPYTNRAHRVILSPKFERKLGKKEFEELKKERRNDILGPSDPNTARVRRIASDIIRGIQDVFPTNGLGDDDAKQGKAAVRPQTGHLDDLQWAVIVITDERANACCLRGGKIVVFTGLLNFLETYAEIAAVIAHEAAHVVARHLMESTILTPPILRDLLPFSRRTELEADLIGMMILAAAGFDPRVAPKIHQKRESMVP